MPSVASQFDNLYGMSTVGTVCGKHLLGDLGRPYGIDYSSCPQDNFSLDERPHLSYVCPDKITGEF
jgi:hypothetical protein